MIGNRVEVIRKGTPPLQGILAEKDADGVTIDDCWCNGLCWGRRFVPWPQIVEIRDCGRSPQ